MRASFSPTSARASSNVWRDILLGVSFLGEVVLALGNLVRSPSRFRGTSLVFHMETFAFRSVPIIALINFLVGCIIAQRGVYQLQRFGATTYAVDLIGILMLRELGVLLTSIMIAGRSGSAVTAEIGSMKMREEIDALHVMGLRSDRCLDHAAPSRVDAEPAAADLHRRHRRLSSAACWSSGAMAASAPRAS